MKTGREIAVEKGILSPPKDGKYEAAAVPMSAFEDARLPLVVMCIHCGMTMSLIGPNCRVDDRGMVWCAECAEMMDDDEFSENPYALDEPLPTVIQRVLMRLDFGRDPHEVTPEEEWDILTEILYAAANDPTITDEEKRPILDALEGWGVMEPELPSWMYADAAEMCWQALGMGDDR